MSKIVKAKLSISMEYGWAPGTDWVRQSWYPHFFYARLDDTDTRVFLEEREIEVDVTNFNPISQQLAYLEQAKREATAEFVRRTAEINEQISKLLAIKHSPAEPPTPTNVVDNLSF